MTEVMGISKIIRISLYHVKSRRLTAVLCILRSDDSWQVGSYDVFPFLSASVSSGSLEHRITALQKRF